MTKDIVKKDLKRSKDLCEQVFKIFTDKESIKNYPVSRDQVYGYILDYLELYADQEKKDKHFQSCKEKISRKVFYIKMEEMKNPADKKVVRYPVSKAEVDYFVKMYLKEFAKENEIKKYELELCEFKLYNKFFNIKKSPKFNTEYFQLFEILLKCTEFSRIIKIIDESKLDTSAIILYQQIDMLSLKLLCISKHAVNTLKTIVMRYEIEKEYIARALAEEQVAIQKKRVHDLRCARKTLSKAISNDILYCNDKSPNFRYQKQQLQKSISLLEEIDDPIYQKLIVKRSEREATIFNKIGSILPKIIYHIENASLMNDEDMKFDSVDMLDMLDMPLKEFATYLFRMNDQESSKKIKKYFGSEIFEYLAQGEFSCVDEIDFVCGNEVKITKEEKAIIAQKLQTRDSLTYRTYYDSLLRLKNKKLSKLKIKHK